MSLFGATLEAATLQPIPELGAAVYVSAPVDNLATSNGPTVAVGATVAIATPANSLAEQWVPTIVAGVQVTPDTANAFADPVAPTAVATSAQVTLTDPVDALSEVLAPAVGAGQSVTPPTVDNAAESLAPVVVAGVNIQPGTVATAAESIVPGIHSGGAVALDDPVDNITDSDAPTLIGAGTNVFPVVQVNLSITDDASGFGSTLEFSTFEGSPTTRSVIIPFNNRSASIAPTVVTGKNVTPLAPVDTISTALAPDIETERRRRMVQAIAA